MAPHPADQYDAMFRERQQRMPQAMRLEFWEHHFVTQTACGSPHMQSRILDLGCGTGEIDIWLARAKPQVRITGLDISAVALETAARHLRAQPPTVRARIHWVRAGLGELPFGAGTFDACLLSHVLEHIAAHESLFHEIGRILKPQAPVLVVVPRDHHHDDPSHVWHFSLPQLRDHLSRWGRVTDLQTSEDQTQIAALLRLRKPAAQTGGPAGNPTHTAREGHRMSEAGGKRRNAIVPAKVIGMLRVRNEARWIGEVLEKAAPLVDGFVILDDGSTDGTADIARRHPKVLEYRHQTMPQTDEVRDKNALLQWTLSHAPDWILALDGDEIVEDAAPAILRHELAHLPPGATRLGFSFLYMWDRADAFRVDGIYADLRHPRMFRVSGLQGDPREWRFAPSRHGSNFHCGSVPANHSGKTHYVDLRIKHFGYFDPALRRRKKAFYVAKDPGHGDSGYYDHLCNETGMRLAGWQERAAEDIWLSAADPRPWMAALHQARNPLWQSGLFCPPRCPSRLDIGSDRGQTLRGFDPTSISCIEAYPPAARELEKTFREVFQGDALALTTDLLSQGRRFHTITLFDVIEHLPREAGSSLLETVEQLSDELVLLFVPLETEALVSSAAYREFMQRQFRRIPPDQHSWQQHRSRWSMEDFQRRGYGTLRLADFHLPGFDALFAFKFRSATQQHLAQERIARCGADGLRQPRAGADPPPPAASRPEETPAFGHLGPRSTVRAPRLLSHPERIRIGADVLIREGARLEALTNYRGHRADGRIEIGDGSRIEFDVHIGAAAPMHIGRKVMMASRVTVLDHDHGYEDPRLPPIDQPLTTAPVRIEDGAWLGENAVVCKGVTIGAHAVIGANAVVTKDIPPRSVAAGVPARVIRSFNQATQQWESHSNRGLQASIIIPVHNQLAHTRACLECIQAHTPSGVYEVIVVDNGSTDGTRAFLENLGSGVRRVANPTNLGFTEACNQGAQAATAPYLVFLNNDTLPRPGWLEALTAGAEQLPAVGAVGAKLIYPDGRLQEAGGVVLADGTTRNFGRGEDPGAPIYNRPCEVDYCSGACLLVRADAFHQLGGFDQRYSPAYYEETDLCFRLRERGYRVIYSPRAEVVHVGSATAGTDISKGYRRYLSLNRAKFVERWGEALKRHEPPPGPGQRVYSADRRFLGVRTSPLLSVLPTEDLGLLPSPEQETFLPAKLYSAVSILLEQGRESDAFTALEDLRNLAPDLAVVHNDLGVFHAQRGEWTLARSSYERAVSLEPRNLTFRKNLGELHWLAFHAPHAALPQYLAVLEQSPNDAEALLALGQISAAAGQTADAEFFLRRLLALQPDHVAARESLADLGAQDSLAATGGEAQAQVAARMPGRIESAGEAEASSLKAHLPTPPQATVPPPSSEASAQRPYPSRIAVVSSRVPHHDRSSADNRIRHLVQMMRTGGTAVLFLHASPGSQTPEYAEGLGAGTALQALPLDARRFQQALTEFAPDCVWFTNLWHLPYVEMVADLVETLKRNTSLRCIVDTMDFHYKKYMRKYHRSQLPEDLSTAMHFWRLERRLYASADVAVTVTATDAADIQRAVAACAPLQVVPNVHPSVFSTTPWEQRDHVCFLGNFAVNHNRDAAQEFACRVLPILRARRAGTEFHLLGPGSEDLVAELAVEGLKGCGYVADLPQALSRYRVFGCALTYGSGMKGKIGEAAAAGLPVVSTPMGLEGFPLTPGEDCLQAEMPEDLADACLRLLEDRALWDRMRRQASATLELHFSAARVEARLRQVLAPLPPPCTPEVPGLPVVAQSAGPRSAQADLAQRLLAKGWAAKYDRYAPLVESVDRRPSATAPALSVVVVTWRYQPETLECLKRLEKERERSYELILVDNGCPEGTLEALYPYADIRVRLGSNTGACVARNIGAVYAQAPLLLFLDDDALPAEHLLAAHLYTHQRYDVIAVRGACRPRGAGNWFNSKAQHYYLGDRPFPRFADIEGNTSYRSEPFFACGGWDDDLFFGHEGAVLALRLWRRDPEWRRQIYSPDPVILHDFAHSADHMQAKRARQRESLQRILQAYPDYEGFLESWKRWHLQQDEILPRPRAGKDEWPPLASRIEARPQDTMVSIVIPTHNRAGLLRQAVESALDQSYRNAEILVVDDASDDGTREVVAAFPDERLRYLPKAHSGAPDTRNAGIAAARGSYILWLDDDDLLLPGALESQVRMVQSHPETDVAYGPHEKFEHGTGRKVGLLDPRDWSLEPRLLLNALLGACPIPNPGTMVRRSVYQDLGAYDLNFHRAHDYEFWSRAAERLVFRKTHHILCRYRIHGSNMSVGRAIDQSYESVIVRRMLARYGFQRLFPFLDWDQADRAESVARFLTAERLFALNDYSNALRLLALVPQAHQTMEMLELQLRCTAYGEGRGALLTALDQAKDHPRAVPYRLGALRQGFAMYFDLLHKADRALRRKDFHQAMEHLEHIAALDHPPSGETLLKSGLLHLHAGDRDQAFKLIRKAVQADPHDLRFAEACRLVQDRQQRRLLAQTRQRVLDPASSAAVTDRKPSAAPPSRQEGATPQAQAVAPEMSVVIPLDRVDARTLRYLRQVAPELDATEVLLVLRKSRSGPGHEGRLRQAVPGARILEVAGAAISVPSMNAGLASARGRLRVWLEPALLGAHDWRRRLLEAHGRVAGAGPVGPVSPAFEDLQRAPSTMRHSSARPEEGCGGAVVHRHRRLPAERLDHRCFMLDRELLRQIGPLDEEYRSGAWALHDYCMRSWASGFVPMVVGDALVLPSPLASSASKRSDLSGLDEKDRRRFRSRWFAAQRPDDSRDRPGALSLLRQLDEALHLDRPEAVERLLADLARIASPHLPLLRPLMAMLHRHGQTQTAVQWLAQAVPAWHDPLPFAMQALALAGAGDSGAARRVAQGVLADAPHLAMAHDVLGIIAFQEQSRGEAEQHFRRAAACDPGYAPAWAHLATLEWEEGSASEALDLFERAFALDPLLPDVAADFGAAAKAAGFSARALGGLEEACRLYPRNKRLRFQLIELLLENEQWPEALRQIGAAAALHGASDGLLDAAMSVRARIAPEAPPAPRPTRRPKVSLCMITRDEQRHLAVCLHSVRDLVDEIIVVDTGSQDRTRDIARLFDAQVLEFPWQEDFAAARNFGLDHATGQVVLVLDADEVIAPQDHDHLQALLRRPAALTTAYRVVTRNYTPLCNLIGWQANEGQYPVEERGTGWTPSEKVRIFPNRPGIRFCYPVHEVVGPALERERLAIAFCEVPVHHYGRMDEALNRRKGEAYYQMGIQKLQELGADQGALQELAVQAELLGQTEEAVALWQRLLELNPQSVRAWLNLSTAFGRLGRFTDAARAATQALALDPSLKEAAFNHAMALLFQNQAEAAAAVLGDLLQREPDYYAARFLCAAAQICAGRQSEGLGTLQALRTSGLWEVLPLSFDDLARRLEMADLAHFSTVLRQASSSLGQPAPGDSLAEDQPASAA